MNSTFIFVLGHAGVVGNEREDMTSGFCYYNRWSSYGCRRHCERSMRVWQKKNARNESTSIGMMQHLGLKMGAARKEHTHVNMRSDVNHRQSPQDWIYYGGYPSTN